MIACVFTQQIFTNIYFRKDYILYIYIYIYT